jgi:PAS domain S-box-containing protein
MIECFGRVVQPDEMTGLCVLAVFGWQDPTLARWVIAPIAYGMLASRREGEPRMARLPTETEYRLLVEYSPVMIWRSGLDAGCDYFNDTWLEFTGRTLEQEMGEGWAEGVHPDDLDGCVTRYLDHFRRRAPFEMEYRLKRHDNVFRWILDRGVPVHDERGDFAGFIGSCVDVDDRRRAHEDRQKRDAKKLQLAREFEEWILAIVSHDIRNPLGAVRMAAQQIELVSDDPKDVRSAVARVIRGVDRIEHIVADLLDFSRERNSGGIATALEDADMSLLCRQVVEELQSIAEGRRIELTTVGDTSGRWDRYRMLQALSNLASNAIQYGVPNMPIRIAVSSEADNVVVTIHNHGAIRPDLLPKIFDPFRSRKGRQERGSGLGLGLFIAKAIACAHAGNIDVVSSSDAGTTFRLALPRRPALAARSE